ncbi:MAG: division/cell wall cluster transcriptional repressor MraZ [Chthoniobacterales bacterium]|jgi:MraZ protein
MSKTTQKQISYAGTFERSMDAKNRVTIPAGWLNGGPDEFHAIPGPSGDCLIMMPPSEFDSIESRIEQSGAPAPERRKAIRQFYGRARAVSADSNGRILLPDEQCEAVKLKGEVVLVGGRSRFEIWNAKRWAAVSSEESDSYRQVAELIGL